jgi:hypothetical protein
MKLDRIDELSKRYGISYTNLDGMADRLRTATEQEFKELKSFYLPSARNRKVSPEEFEASMRKRSTTGDSFRYYKKPEPETEPTMAHLNLFALFKECGRDYDKLYDALMACSPEQLAYAARAGKVQATPEALVVHVYNTRASWGTAEPATAYSRTSGFTYKETSMPENIDINNMSRKELLEYAAQKGLTLTGTTELMRDRLRRILNRGVTLKSISEFSTKQDAIEQLLEQAETEPTKTEPTKTELTDADFYIRTCTVDWDCLVVDKSQVDLRKAAELVRLATRTKAGIPVSIPVLIEYNAESDVKSVWRVVAKHTHAYAACKLCKLWNREDCTVEWGKFKPCEASGMVRVNTLNACSVGVGLGKEQPSAEYIADVLAMLD